MKKLFNLDLCLGEFGDLEELHLLERAEVNANDIEKFLKGELEASDDVKELYQQAVGKLRSTVDNEELRTLILNENILFDSFKVEASRIWTYLHLNIHSYEEGLPEVADIMEHYPESVNDFIESLLLRKRSERYNIVDGKEPGTYLHVPKEAPCLEAILYKKCLDFNSAVLKSRATERATKFRNQLLENVSKAVEEKPERNYEEWNEFLAQNKIVYNGKTFALERIDLASNEKYYTPQTATLISTIITSDWTSSVSQTLRSILTEIEQNLTKLRIQR